jgi:hypothetical protein
MSNDALRIGRNTPPIPMDALRIGLAPHISTDALRIGLLQLRKAFKSEADMSTEALRMGFFTGQLYLSYK